jgi:hypothetical protein
MPERHIASGRVEQLVDEVASSDVDSLGCSSGGALGGARENESLAHYNRGYLIAVQLGTEERRWPALPSRLYVSAQFVIKA